MILHAKFDVTKVFLAQIGKQQVEHFAKVRFAIFLQYMKSLLRQLPHSLSEDNQTGLLLKSNPDILGLGITVTENGGRFFQFWNPLIQILFHSASVRSTPILHATSAPELRCSHNVQFLIKPNEQKPFR